LPIAFPHRNNLEQEVSLLPLLFFILETYDAGLLGEGIESIQNNPAVKH
jgi:hypothetical protein